MRVEGRVVRLDGKVDVGQDLQAVLRVVFCGGGGGVVPGHPQARRNQEASRRCVHPRRAQRLWHWEVGGGRCYALNARPGLVVG